MVAENIVGYLYGVDMTRQEAINILLDHFSAGFVRTIEDALNKEWIGLTHEEISVEWFAVFDAEPGIGKNITNGVFDFANAIEAKLKEKNT